jgi:hypothetical protein
MKKEKSKCENFDEISTWKEVELIDSNYKEDPDGFDVCLMVFDPTKGEDEPGLTINTYVNCKCGVEDFGIGAYEFWGAKGVDTQIGYCVNELDFDNIFPDNMQKIISTLEEKMAEEVGAITVEKDCDDYYDDVDYDKYYDR